MTSRQIETQNLVLLILDDFFARQFPRELLSVTSKLIPLRVKDLRVVDIIGGSEFCEVRATDWPDIKKMVKYDDDMTIILDNGVVCTKKQHLCYTCNDFVYFDKRLYTLEDTRLINIDHLSIQELQLEGNWVEMKGADDVKGHRMAKWGSYLAIITWGEHIMDGEAFEPTRLNLCTSDGVMFHQVSFVNDGVWSLFEFRGDLILLGIKKIYRCEPKNFNLSILGTNVHRLYAGCVVGGTDVVGLGLINPHKPTHVRVSTRDFETYEIVEGEGFWRHAKHISEYHGKLYVSSGKYVYVMDSTKMTFFDSWWLFISKGKPRSEIVIDLFGKFLVMPIVLIILLACLDCVVISLLGEECTQPFQRPANFIMSFF